MDYFGFSLDTIPSSTKEGVLAPLYQEQSRQIRSRVQNALRTPFMMNNASLKELQLCFDHQLIFSDQILYSPHPIFASHLHIDTVELYAEAQTHRNRAGHVKPFIDIGGALKKVSESFRHGLPVHSCNLVNDPRDLHRHVANSVSIDESDNLRADLLSHLYQKIQFGHPNFCGGCTEKCTFKCEFAIGIHSIYDMTPEMMYDTFEHHGLISAAFTFLVPYELNFPLASTARQYANRFPYKFEVDNDIATMHFSDGDFPYRHSFTNWQFWTRASLITGRDFSISINVVRRHGINWKLRLCRIPRSPYHDLRRIIPCDFLSSYCLIPNLFEYAFNINMTADQLSKITVPREFYNRVFNFVIKPEQVTISNVYQFALSIISRIDIASVTVNHAWTADARVINEATYSIIFMALATRRLDRNLTLESFRLIDKQERQDETISLLERASTRLYTIYCSITSFFGYSDHYSHPTDASIRVKNMIPTFYDDLAFDINHHVHYYNPFPLQPNNNVDFDFSTDNVTRIIRDHDNVEPLTRLINDKLACPIEQRIRLPLPFANDVSDIANVTDSYNTNENCPPTPSDDDYTTPTISDPIEPSFVNLTDDIDFEFSYDYNDHIDTSITKVDVLPVVHRVKPISAARCKNRKFNILKTDHCVISDENYSRAIRNLPSYKLKTPRTTEKLQGILDNFGIKLSYPLLDIGAAPGFFSVLYNGPADALQYVRQPVIKQNRSKYRTLLNVTDNLNLTNDLLNDLPQYKTILCDAAGPTFTPKICSLYLEFVAEQHPETFIIKLFTTDDNTRIFRFLVQYYEKVTPFKPYASKEFSSEYYLVCTSPTEADVDESFVNGIYKEEWLIHEKVAQALRETTHHVPVDVSTSRIEPFSVKRDVSITVDEVEAAIRYYSTLDNSRYRAILSSVDPLKVPLTRTITIITGVAGAGKSIVASKLASGVSMIVTPTNKLKEHCEYSRDFSNWQVATPHVAMTKTADTILIDECFTQAIAYPFILAYLCRSHNIILAGSVSQIGAIDPTNILAGTRRVADVIQDVNFNSIRIPHDVARLISGMQPGVSSSSNIARSIIHMPTTDKKYAEKFISDLGYRTYAYNRETRSFLQKLSQADTVHQLQGSTTNRAILYIDEVAVDTEFRHRLQHIMVGLTRHTDTLILLGRVDEVTRMLYYNNTAFERNDEIFKQAHGDFIGEVPHDRRNKIDVVSENINYPSVSADVIVDILKDVIITTTQDDNEAAIQQTDSKPPATGKLRVKIWPFLAQYRKIIRGKYLGYYRFARRYTPSTFGTIRCFLERYARRTKNGDQVEDTIKLIEGLATWCNDYTHDADLHLTHEYSDFLFADSVLLGLSPQAISFLAALQRELYKTIGGKTADNLATYFVAEYAKNLQSKGIRTDQADIDFQMEQYRRCVDFFVKKQVKPDVRDFFDQRDKVHQGISAWQKYQNFLFASYTRMFTAVFQNLLRPNVIFASNEPDNVIAARASHFIADAEDKLSGNAVLNNFAADFEQFDSSVTNAGPGMNAVLMYVMGCPCWLCLDYMEQRGNWRLTEKWIQLLGRDKMHSGEPWTLMGNTIYNMSVLGAAFEFIDYVVALFKGDDSGIIGGVIKSRYEEYLTEHGMSIKIETSCALEFAGFFINRYGGFPDVLRRATKFASTVYRDRQHFDDSVINLRAELAIIRDNTAFLYGCHQCAAYYNEIKRTQPVSAGQIQLIAGAMYHQSFSTYGDLLDFEKSILAFRHSELLY
jgi:hypothetical protein